MDTSGAPHNGHALTDITCRELVELVTDYLEDALDGQTLGRVQKHLIGCGWCVTYVEQMQTTIDGLAELRDPAVPEPPDSVLAVLRGRWGALRLCFVKGRSEK